MFNTIPAEFLYQKCQIKQKYCETQIICEQWTIASISYCKVNKSPKHEISLLSLVIEYELNQYQVYKLFLRFGVRSFIGSNGQNCSTDISLECFK